MKKNSNPTTHIDQPLIFLRHGETAWNASGRYQGHHHTLLSDTGRQQAVKCADDIAEFVANNAFPQQDLNIVSSPLSRALETAGIIANKLGIDLASVEIAEELKELSMGRWEGLNSQQVKDQFYIERQSRKTDRWHFKPRGGESLSERAPEIANWLTTVRANSIIVTHSGVLKIIHQILTMSHHDQSSVIKVGHAEIWARVCDKLHTSTTPSAQS